MEPLEKIKLVGELHKKINARNAEKDPIKKMALTNEVLELQKILVGDIDEKEIDVEKINTDLSSYLAKEPIFEAVRNYYRENLQGKFIQTEIGRVFLSGATWQKMKSGLKSDEVKAALIPYVPFILKGTYDGRRELTKERRDRYIAFHAFSRAVKIGTIIVNARVTVGETENHQYEYIAYSLHYSESTKAILPVAQVDSLRGQNSLAGENNLTLGNVLLDNADVNIDGWNIEIISITDLNGDPIILGE